MAAALIAYDGRIETTARSDLTIEQLLGDGSDGKADHSLAPGEMITSIALQPPMAGERARYKRAIGRAHAGARVAITEPVFDYVLHAASLTIATPPSFSHAIEEGNDPAPQDVDTMRTLLSSRTVAAFVYNSQTVEPSTVTLLEVARAAGTHVVPVTETLPAGETTQHWIDREVAALERAL